MIRIFQIILFVVLALPVNANTLPTSNNIPESSNVPGGVVSVHLDLSVKDNPVAPNVYFQNKQVLIFDKDGEYYALVGLPLSLKSDNYYLEYSDAHGRKYQKKFHVKNKYYDISRINIQNKNMVNPDEATQKIIAEDSLKIAKATQIFTTNSFKDLMFANPVEGIPTTSFGSRRIINNQAKNPHSGMDIAAETGTLVRAGMSGKVVLADPFYYSGNMVAIDHGQGLISMYAHLSKISVKIGDDVQTNDVVGEVGSTGRATGPHLHWTVKLNNAAVDPALFLAKSHNNSKEG